MSAAKTGPNARSRFWKTFAFLYSLGLFGVAAGLPYIFALVEGFLKKSPEPLSVPLSVLYFLQFLQLAALLAFAVGIGLFAARKIGCGAPLIEGWLAGERVGPEFRAILQPSILLGLGVGVILLLLFVFVFMPLTPELRTVLISDVALWKKFLASFYGGIFEEILMRLFLVSVFTWLLRKVWSGRNWNSASFWVASAVVAVIFGLGHLGAASLMLTITPMVVVTAVILNGAAALAFSYLYWKHGLEAAIIAHFSADIVLHVIGSALLRA
jgi:hypothetical protein